MRNDLDRLGADNKQDDPAEHQVVNPQNQISFIVPTELVDLPSGGKYYPKHHPLHRKDTIEIKQMTAKEEDILSSKSLIKKGVAIDKLIQSLVVDKSINTDTLTTEDRGAIIVAARISAYGQEYQTSVVCPSCDTKTKSKFDLLEKLEALPSEEELIEVDDAGHFSISLPRTKWALKCRALTGYDEKELIRLSETRKNMLGGDSLIVEQLKQIVVSVNGVTEKSIINQSIDALPAGDAKYLRSFYRKAFKGVDLRHTFKCSSCGHEGVLEVPLTVDFFWFD